ncbi:anaerobic ribonucleoside triphosphate reductase [Petroclostridium sp. X23]|uniref:anaerobic ribonucleoside triphosphate reductase n=1 Tax=Petroclostridium sp. X23 TaxID=3045146 RepID=UPI0024AC8E2F|nr:anaerobic ribonucleoside triphosphate reductase [Petroclostridium sp. X23]WHH60950.1 anaerobic ribonucleoside triphosphate reductase [Petroclostridium sp. X23]
MIEKIKKRDGRIVDFHPDKITNAIFRAAKKVGGNKVEIAKQLTDKVVEYIENKLKVEIPEVEQIQDAVEKVLIENGHAATAKEYILYRAERTRIREKNSRLMQLYKGITYEEVNDDHIKIENTNVDGDTAMGTMLRYGSEGAKTFNEMFILKPEHTKAHKAGDIHIHDMDFLTLTMNCCQIDVQKLFKNGFSTGHGHLREPNDVASYATLAAIAIQANQNDQHGGQSIPFFDFGIAPGVAKTYIKLYKTNMAKFFYTNNLFTKDNCMQIVEQVIDQTVAQSGLKPSIEPDWEYYKSEMENFLPYIKDKNVIQAAQMFARKWTPEEVDRETFEAMEAFINILNSMRSKAGTQITVSSINFGTDTSPEGRMVSKNLLLAIEKGLGNGETPIFPISIFKVKAGVSYHQGDPNYDLFKLACKVSAKRLLPNFSFMDAIFNGPYSKKGIESEVAYIGCRTRVIENIYEPTKEITSGRGNLTFTSINLPRIALMSKGNVNNFFAVLDEKIDLVIDQLLERMEIQSRKKVKNFPFLMGQGVWIDSEKLEWEDEVREVIRHGTLALGFIGLAETLTSLMGKHHGESKDAQELGLKIVKHMRKRMDEASTRCSLNFSLYAVPTESLSQRFVTMDRERFGIIPGVTDKAYYTDSFHIPVSFNISVFDKIQKEAPYHTLTNGGHIAYVEMDGDFSKNLSAFETVVRAMYDAGIGYGSINHPVDRDPVCGYTGVVGEQCPKCGRMDGEQGIKFERIRRTTGDLSGDISRWNDAQKIEIKDRVTHSLRREFIFL